jgi:hypothetical protein
MTALDLAVQEYLGRRAGLREPHICAGPDDAPWPASPTEKRACCDAARGQMPEHLLSVEHVAALFDVRPEELRRALDAGHNPEGAPLFIAPVIGWRGWAVHRTREGAELLEAIAIDFRVTTTWPPLRAWRAECAQARDHDAPDPACVCGWHACRTLDDAVEACARILHARDVQARRVAFGPVALWGRVIEHERGWRAQYAYPQALYVGAPELVSPLAKAYRVPVEHAASPALPERARRLIADVLSHQA